MFGMHKGFRELMHDVVGGRRGQCVLMLLAVRKRRYVSMMPRSVRVVLFEVGVIVAREM